jgi:hypothetical protein
MSLGGDLPSFVLQGVALGVDDRLLGLQAALRVEHVPPGGGVGLDEPLGRRGRLALRRAISRFCSACSASDLSQPGSRTASPSASSPNNACDPRPAPTIPSPTGGGDGDRGADSGLDGDDVRQGQAPLFEWRERRTAADHGDQRPRQGLGIDAKSRAKGVLEGVSRAMPGASPYLTHFGAEFSNVRDVTSGSQTRSGRSRRHDDLVRARAPETSIAQRDRRSRAVGSSFNRFGPRTNRAVSRGLPWILGTGVRGRRARRGTRSDRGGGVLDRDRSRAIGHRRVAFPASSSPFHRGRKPEGHASTIRDVAPWTIGRRVGQRDRRRRPLL